MTTFKGKADPVNWARRRGLRKFKYSIPIKDELLGGLFPLGQFQLIFHPDSERLADLTYVREQHIWAIPVVQLSNYFFVQSHAFSARLDESSTRTLVKKYFGLEPQSYMNVEEVLTTAEERLTTLSETEGKGDN